MANGWTVIAQQPSQDLGPTGALVDVVRVTFQLVPDGPSGTVTVPLAGYGPESVSAAIQPLADAMAAVAAL